MELKSRDIVAKFIVLTMWLVYSNKLHENKLKFISNVFILPDDERKQK